MRTRNLIAVLLTATLLGCSGTDAAKQSDAADGGTDSAVATTPGGSSVEGEPGGTPDPAGPDAPSATVAADPAALAALNHYLDALGANDFTSARDVSRGPVQSLTIVRWVVFLSNKDNGGATTSTFTDRSLGAVSASQEEVRYAGRATIVSTVSGASGPPVSTTDTFTHVTVRKAGGAWRVAEATYNDAPVVSFPGTSTTTAGPIDIALVGSVAFGRSLAVVLQVTSNGEHTLDLAGARLRIQNEQAPATTSLVVGGQPGYLYTTFVRRDDRPSEWTATLTVDGAPHAVSLAF